MTPASPTHRFPALRPWYIARMSEQTNGSEDRPGREPTYDEIARRAFEISLGEHAGTDAENWQRAERELRGEAQQDSQA